ncbi:MULTISPECIES: LuxR C-terminal-related transcriptional regulator [Rhizobium/Agrobacterium group]|uniref:LuxR C-terminal-related transcriptional regulator n=1 Tax=Rhizobium/Agrobacterium group TaxID=227290 RepID=UPI0022CB69C9|nr:MULTISPECIES: LuxR C-terminal-related transcriptional regulator [Rhizobium/Agrobacterium group]MCZ7486191.1 LuxR C-terminal-related transcriptional regulator [Rhizobium rhizogenes]MDA5636006.1 LuxR C-terminal-related transcriptional regulator [Agrobacterium sp. ST15.16.024]MDF1891084.1 LuxR C-terminal-related transcriptional regulator [Rhizobium rhizogenes]
MPSRVSREKQLNAVRTFTGAGLRFSPPRMLFSGIERPYLLSKLAAGLSRQIVVLRAPPGFGKTALMKAAYERLVNGTLTLPGMRETAVSHCSWLNAFSIASPERLVAELLQSLGLAAMADKPEAMTNAMDTVARREGETVLFIDNIDNIEIAARHSLLERLILSAPDNLRIALSSCSPAQLPLGRLKARGVLAELTARDLEFGRSELRRLLSASAMTALVDPLMEITRGWPALAQLAARIVDGNPTDEERRVLLAATHLDLTGYVRETVVDRLSPTVLSMLRSLSPFQEFRLDLASDLGFSNLSQEDLTMIESMHPIIENGQNGWLSLHPVLRACLEREAAFVSDAEKKAMHRQAALWFAKRGHLERAVSHAAQSGDFRMAEEIIGKAGGVDIFLRAGHQVLEQLIDNFPPDVLHASPGLMVSYAVVLSKRGNASAGRERLDILKENGEWSAAALSAVDRSVLDHIDSLIDVYEDRRMTKEEAERLERAAAALPPHATWELAWLFNHLCIIYTRTGQLEEARRAALKALGYYREEKTPYAQVFMLIHLGLVSTLKGEFSAALQFCREAEELVERVHWTDRNLLAIVRLAMADVLYQQGDVLQVEQSLTDCMEPLIRGESWVDLFTRLFWLLARSRLQVSGFDAAAAALDKAEEVAVERNLPRLKTAAAIMRIDLLVRVGMIESAIQTMERAKSLKELGGSDNWTWREAYDFDIATARLALAQGQASRALQVLEALILSARASGRAYHRMLAEIMAVQASWKAGRQQQAFTYLQSAIALARTHEATQLFTDEGHDLAATLRAIVRRFGLKVFSPNAVEFMSRIVGHGFGRKPRMIVSAHEKHGGIAPASGLLSGRELTVLKLLSEGRSNKEIARELGLSESTVKFHLKNIYAKLGVSRRGMAVSVSRHLKLTEPE